MVLKQDINVMINKRVILSKNLCCNAGLVNGATGTIIDIILKPTLNGYIVYAIMVQFDGYVGLSWSQSVGKVVPIIPRLLRWHHTKSKHKLQGQSTKTRIE